MSYRITTTKCPTKLQSPTKPPHCQVDTYKYLIGIFFIRCTSMLWDVLILVIVGQSFSHLYSQHKCTRPTNMIYQFLLSILHVKLPLGDDIHRLILNIQKLQHKNLTDLLSFAIKEAWAWEYCTLLDSFIITKSVSSLHIKRQSAGLNLLKNNSSQFSWHATHLPAWNIDTTLISRGWEQKKNSLLQQYLNWKESRGLVFFCKWSFVEIRLQKTSWWEGRLCTPLPHCHPQLSMQGPAHTLQSGPCWTCALLLEASSNPDSHAQKKLITKTKPPESSVTLHYTENIVWFGKGETTTSRKPTSHIYVRKP